MQSRTKYFKQVLKGGLLVLMVGGWERSNRCTKAIRALRRTKPALLS